MQTTTKKKANDLQTILTAFAALAAALFGPTTAAARSAQQPALYTHVIVANTPWIAGDPTGRREVLRFTSSNPTTTGREIMARYWAQKWEQIEALQAKVKAEGLVYSPEARGFVAPAAAKPSDAFRAHFDPKAQPVKSPPDLDARTREGDTFRAYFAEGARPVASPAILDRRPRPFTL
jgi:hypothetical protein